MRAGSEEGTYATTPVIGKLEISGGYARMRNSRCTIPSPGLCRATSHAHRAHAGIYGVNVTCHLRTARHSIRVLQAVEKGEELVARSIATGRAIQWCCPSNGRERDRSSVM